MKQSIHRGGRYTVFANSRARREFFPNGTFAEALTLAEQLDQAGEVNAYVQDWLMWERVYPPSAANPDGRIERTPGAVPVPTATPRLAIAAAAREETGYES